MEKVVVLVILLGTFVPYTVCNNQARLQIAQTLNRTFTATPTSSLSRGSSFLLQLFLNMRGTDAMEREVTTLPHRGSHFSGSGTNARVAPIVNWKSNYEHLRFG